MNTEKNILQDRVRFACLIGKIATAVFLIGYIIGTVSDYMKNEANGMTQEMLKSMIVERTFIFLIFAPLSWLVFSVFGEMGRGKAFGRHFIRLLNVASWLSIGGVLLAAWGLALEQIDFLGFLFLFAGLLVFPCFLFSLKWTFEKAGLLEKETDLTI